MSYDIQVPSLTPHYYKSLEIIRANRFFKVYKHSGMLHLEINGYIVGTIFQDDISQSRYKTYENWIKSLKTKDLKKLKKSKELVAQLQKDCQLIESIWENV